MPNLTISMPDELYFKLKTIENKSGLITSLLFDYFKTYAVDKSSIEKQLTETRFELEEEIRNRQDTIKKLEEQKLQILNKEEIDEDRQKLKIARDEQFKANFFHNYKILTDAEATEEQYLKFKKFWDENKNSSIFEFIENEK